MNLSIDLKYIGSYLGAIWLAGPQHRSQKYLPASIMSGLLFARLSGAIEPFDQADEPESQAQKLGTLVRGPPDYCLR